MSLPAQGHSSKPVPNDGKAAGKDEEGGAAWPQGASREPLYAIGQVVRILEREFPATTVSKVRFLEEKGLVSPNRTASGYRKYCQADVERIRFVLTQQRDSYAPLKVIGEQLQALDAGHDVVPERRARIVASEGKTVLPVGKQSLSVRELSDLTGVTREQLDQYVRLGLIAPDLGGRFGVSTVAVVQNIGALIAAGVPARNLRTVRSGAERSADLVDQVLLSSMRRDRPGDRERRQSRAEELASLLADLHTSLLRVATETLGE